MTIKSEEHKRQLRIKFGVLLMEHEMNLMSFCKKYKKELYEMLKTDRSIKGNYKLIYNRLNKCVNIDLEFIQKLIDLVDNTQKVKVVEITNKNGKKEDVVRIGKIF
jgi:hypothetical protein